MRFPTEVLDRTGYLSGPIGHAKGPDRTGRTLSVPNCLVITDLGIGEEGLQTPRDESQTALRRVHSGLRQAAAPVIRANHNFCAPSEPNTSAPFPSEEAPPRHPPPETIASALCDVCMNTIGLLGDNVNRTP